MFNFANKVRICSIVFLLINFIDDARFFAVSDVIRIKCHENT